MTDQLILEETKKFREKGYVHLEEFLDEKSCKDLTNELIKLANNKKTIKDHQCPTSEAIYGHSVFDSMLEQLLPNVEYATGKKLYPTYSYARLYTAGEELKNHTDRESCEISLTVTLGFDGDVWPIYFGDDIEKNNAVKIDMRVGDAVLYRGIEKHHWREKYTEGKWQAQVFLHYVDADGPHKEWKYDKRDKLGIENNQKFKEESHLFWWYGDILTHQACDSIIRTYTQNDIEKLPPIVGAGEGSIDTNIRNVSRIMLPTYKDIGGRLAAVGLSANHHVWKFNITHANQAEFLEYPAGGKYVGHMDTFINPNTNESRKLTILAFLNDDYEGGKFFISDGDRKIYPPQEKGVVLVFPSFLVHGVEDVTKGTRYSVVCWMVGPFFK